MQPHEMQPEISEYPHPSSPVDWIRVLPIATAEMTGTIHLGRVLSGDYSQYSVRAARFYNAQGQLERDNLAIKVLATRSGIDPSGEESRFTTNTVGDTARRVYDNNWDEFLIERALTEEGVPGVPYVHAYLEPDKATYCNTENSLVSGKSYIVMDQIQGEPLHTLLDTLSLEDGLEIVDSLLTTLAVLQTAQARRGSVVHREIKPENVLVDLSGEETRATLIDFGFALQAQDIPQITNVPFIEGSLAYMAPEQYLSSSLFSNLANRPIIGTWTDPFGLGIVLWETITKKKYSQFVALQDGGIHTQKRLQSYIAEPDHRYVEPLRRELEKVEDIPLALIEIVMKATSPRPKDRYQNAQQMQQALRAVLQTY